MVITNGTGSVAFGSTTVGVPISQTFTIKNLGTANLTSTRPTAVPAGFTITSSFGATTLAPGASTTLTVRLDAKTAGAYSGKLLFGDTDIAASTFSFTLSGVVSLKISSPVSLEVEGGSFRPTVLDR